MSLIFTKTDINELLSEVLNGLSALVKSKQLRYEFSLPRMTLIAFVDKDALKKALWALSYNAVKCAEREVHIKLRPFNSDDNRFNVDIHNDGALIPTERILTPRALVELHKGSLKLIPAEEGRSFLRLSIPILQEGEYSSNPLPLYQENTDQETLEKDFIRRLNTIIYDNISDIELNVDELAKLMNMSRPTLYRRIKGLSDSTPNELINISRLKKAAELLSQKTYNITQVASMVGYSVQSNFSRDFHKHYGMPPSIYIATMSLPRRTAI
ncbi:two-component system sensor histidine kinase [Pedobacter sp. BAL39]|uniref:helix-turn-helix domain-containing protein n=1 Tax=Pedobacter sp. BAL39 TaxID=391596 RepID=UPI000155B254|nr:helix-turn-helix domain-containing protein [Pedobacter sp. BAL39]EDM34639.1 two-component system sensor histidine kinase [Pedobacter sp. BAL39]